ncbi:hypothetical protein IE077_003801, partial [Cardiosporidium cionae]
MEDHPYSATSKAAKTSIAANNNYISKLTDSIPKAENNTAPHLSDAESQDFFTGNSGYLTSARLEMEDLRRIAHPESMLFAETARYEEVANVRLEGSGGDFREKQKNAVLKKAEFKLEKRRRYQSTSGRGKGTSNQSIVGMRKTLNSTTRSSVKSRAQDRDVGLISYLLDRGYTPERIALLSDVLEQPAALDKVDATLLPWLEMQRSRGYWYDRASLIMLALTAAIGRGHIESFWNLMSSWHGMIFIIPYFLVYLLICMPILNFELSVGQLTRSSPPNMFALLYKRSRGLGIAMVLVTITSGCIVQSRYSAEFLVYLIYSFRNPKPWKLTESERISCEAIGKNEKLCTDVAATCIFSIKDQICKGSDAGK